ncbi:MAG: hypothetical protein IRZ28_17195 [Steroidobacteraceae bacterium]|nr:hypothetical protein [Steroidobacteraceae bacterium]
MAWESWPEKLANGEVADANDVLDALDLIKQHVLELEDALSGGGLVHDDDPRLSDARTPTPHGASHAPGGTDPLMKSVSVTYTTGGDGSGSGSAAHGLGRSPVGAACVCTSGSIGGMPSVAWDSTNVYVASVAGAGFPAFLPVTFRVTVW